MFEFPTVLLFLQRIIKKLKYQSNLLSFMLCQSTKLIGIVVKFDINFTIFDLSLQYTMSDFEMVSIGFGNMTGQTSIVLVSEQKNRIQIGTMTATHVEPPKIQVKTFESKGLGNLTDCVRKKRDQMILSELLKVDIECNTDQIAKNCQQISSKIANDLAVLGAMMEDTKTDAFRQKTNASSADATKYLEKYKKLEQAVKVYQQHQKMILTFSEQQKCDKETAKNFLEANNYDPSILQ